MKLSVITICYNIKDEIERTCASIAAQTTRDFEWIVVDGGSTDGTIDILNKYKEKMAVFISEPDKGIYNAMNKGIKKATGEYLNFMNGGDCFAADDVIEKFYQCSAYGADVVYGNCNIISSKGTATPANIPETVTKAYFYEGYTINHQASFIRRSLFNKYGLYNENYKIVSDWEKWIIFIINKVRFVYWENVVANFYEGGISSTAYDLHDYEVAEVCGKYYTAQEVAQIINKRYKKYGITLFNCVPLCKIIKDTRKNKTVYKLFDFLPIYKIKKRNNKSEHYLFGFIPFLKIKEK